MGLTYKFLGKHPTTFKEFQDKLTKLDKRVSSGTITVKSRYNYICFDLENLGKDRIWLEYIAKDTKGKKLAKLLELKYECKYSKSSPFAGGFRDPIEELDNALIFACERAKKIGFSVIKEPITINSRFAETIMKFA